MAALPHIRDTHANGNAHQQANRNAIGRIDGLWLSLMFHASGINVFGVSPHVANVRPSTQTATPRCGS
jgi:hypothetical protein